MVELGLCWAWVEVAHGSGFHCEDAAGRTVREASISPSTRVSVVGEVDVWDNLLAKLDDESHGLCLQK